MTVLESLARYALREQSLRPNYFLTVELDARQLVALASAVQRATRGLLPFPPDVSRAASVIEDLTERLRQDRLIHTADLVEHGWVTYGGLPDGNLGERNEPR